MISFTKFAIFVEFAAFWIAPSFARRLKSKSLWQMSSSRHFRQIRHFHRNRGFPDTLSFARCLKSVFKAKCRQIVTFAKFAIFCQIRHFPDTPSFAHCLKSKSLWQNVVNTSLSPNSPFSSNSSLSGCPLFHSLSQI